MTYLTDAHRACAQRISHWMREIGFDEVEIDAVGNVVGRYRAATEGAKTLLTGSHYDTVRNGGKYDGRLGIFVPMACVKQLVQQGKRLPFNIEVVGFSEEEGQRYKATFLGSGALVGDFKQEWLEQKDADGITLREAMLHAGLCIDDIPKLERDPAKYLGFVEVHIEQGPVLNEPGHSPGHRHLHQRQRPLCLRIHRHGQPRRHHAHGPPPRRRSRRGRAVAVHRKRAGQDGDSVATIGQANVPSGSVNVVPGRCQFSLDLRAPTNEQRDAMINDIMAEMAAIAERRGLRYTTDLSMKAAAAPSAPEWQKRWGKRCRRTGRAPVPHAQRCRSRRHEAARNHAPGHVVRARHERRHQPQPAGSFHLRRHATVRGCLHPPPPPTGSRTAMTNMNQDKQATYAAIDAWIDEHFDEEVKFLQAMVQVPTDTPPGNNAPMPNVLPI